MVIDVREMQNDIELLKKVKEVLSSYCGKEITLEILINSCQNPARVVSYISMSGCQAVFEEKEGYYLVKVSGSVCCI